MYRPGYGHLSATFGHCWQQHDLCLYGLDILSQLWSALYLQVARSTGLLSAQAEYQARILPALAAQLAAETTGCGHGPARSQPGQKTPATSHGYRDATADEQQLTDWFGSGLGWNLAIAAGAPGPDVLDVD